MEDERGGGASVAEAAKKLGLASVTLDAVDRSGRQPDGQPASNIPPGLDVVAQAFASDVGVDNEPISYRGGYVWYEVLGITPPRDRTLDEVKDQVSARWREDEIATRLSAKATELVKKLNEGGKLADEATAAGVQVETAASFKRDCDLAGRARGRGHGCLPHRQGQRQSDRSRRRQPMGRVPRHRHHDAAGRSGVGRRQEAEGRACSAALSQEQSAQYVARLEKDIGTTINEAAVAQVVGSNQ